jgi:hypothetical protein
VIPFKQVNNLLATAMVPELTEGKTLKVAKAVLLEYSKEKELFLFPGQTDIPVIISNLVHMTQIWNNLRQACSKSKLVIPFIVITGISV